MKPDEAGIKAASLSDPVGEGLSRKTEYRNLSSDMAPIEGRDALVKTRQGLSLTWNQGAFSLFGQLDPIPGPGEISVRIEGDLKPTATRPTAWVEWESSPSGPPLVYDLFLAGSRPLPDADVNCICRHPGRPGLLLAAVQDRRLLFLDGDLSANLSQVGLAQLPQPAISMAVCGDRVIVLTGADKPALFILELHPTALEILGITRLELATGLVALAEDDGKHLLGLARSGVIWRMQILAAADRTARLVMTRICRLRKKALAVGGIRQMVLRSRRGAKGHDYSLWRLCSGGGGFRTLAYDGCSFWITRGRGRRGLAYTLSRYDLSGQLRQTFSIWPEASVFNLGFIHNRLMVLDRAHSRFHWAHICDSMRPAAGSSLAGGQQPGYLAAGTSATAGIHDLCLLYAGGQGRQNVFRYSDHTLRPLVGYVSAQGEVEDTFMDGFLMLAQYSPLLNGRAFAPDLKGPPSRREDWAALFDEYFHPRSNLAALDNCAAEIARRLALGVGGLKLKVVLAVPTPDPRCTDWSGRGTSLSDPARRVDTLTWAMQDLLDRWARAGYDCLDLAGFYYMDEQGRYDDPVLNAFPGLCRRCGIKSFAVPGLTSTWMTEFKRVGFDAVALQSSHAFRRPSGCGPRYWLKCAGHIARDYEMGMEVELPYNVLEPAGQAIVSDYLDMARIQGWDGGFKAYFQSYDLISQLARSLDPAGRALYEELYGFSRQSRKGEAQPLIMLQGSVPVRWESRFRVDEGESRFRLNFEGLEGELHIARLSIVHRQ